MRDTNKTRVHHQWIEKAVNKDSDNGLHNIRTGPLPNVGQTIMTSFPPKKWPQSSLSPAGVWGLGRVAPGGCGGPCCLTSAPAPHLAVAPQRRRSLQTLTCEHFCRVGSFVFEEASLILDMSQAQSLDLLFRTHIGLNAWNTSKCVMLQLGLKLAERTPYPHGVMLILAQSSYEVL